MRTATQRATGTETPRHARETRETGAPLSILDNGKLESATVAKWTSINTRQGKMLCFERRKLVGMRRGSNTKWANGDGMANLKNSTCVHNVTVEKIHTWRRVWASGVLFDCSSLPRTTRVVFFCGAREHVIYNPVSLRNLASPPSEMKFLRGTNSAASATTFHGSHSQPAHLSGSPLRTEFDSTTDKWAAMKNVT